VNIRALIALSMLASSLVPAPEAGAQDACCDVVANPALRRLGRLVVAYPEKVSARIDVFRADDTTSIANAYGDKSIDLLPGSYDVTITGKRVAGVTIRAGHDTQIKVGVLRVIVSDGTRIDLVSGDQQLASGYGTEAYGLPIGEVGVEIAGQTEMVTVEAGQVTEF
jgi:hypothetical protein